MPWMTWRELCASPYRVDSLNDTKVLVSTTFARQSSGNIGTLFSPGEFQFQVGLALSASRSPLAARRSPCYGISFNAHPRLLLP